MKRELRPIKRLLIANRGEIACRIAKTCKKLGIISIGVYSDADRNSLFLTEVDETIPLGGVESKESYLDINKILTAAKRSKADAIHPGYGFLSENAEFASAITKSGAIFIGPSAKMIRGLGDKLRSKEMAVRLGVPIAPSYAWDGSPKGHADLLKWANGVKGSLLVKASAGGGGRGMRRVTNRSELQSSLESASREALKFFNDPRVFVEKLIEPARHIEVQILGDIDGKIAVIGDRDCTWQRHHQKMIEEAPAPNISAPTRKALHNAAIKLASEVKYLNAGTVEFLLDKDGFYFMEVNSRLQVEHPVTEMVTGLDLVELQIGLASGRLLTELLPTPIKINGNAIEARLCAESPENGFIPSSGTIIKFNIPKSKGVRVDSGIATGSSINHYYDSLLAKIVGFGKTREDARSTLADALDKTELFGLKCNAQFLKSLIDSPEFKAVTHNITLAPKKILSRVTIEKQIAQVGAISALYDLTDRNNIDPWNALLGFQLGTPHLSRTAKYIFEIDANVVTAAVSREGDRSYIAHVLVSGKIRKLRFDKVKRNGENLSFFMNGESGAALIGDAGWIHFQSSYQVLKYIPKKTNRSAEANSNEILTPLPGKIVDLKAQIGDKVVKGDTIVVLESMKMEHPLISPRDGTIKEVLVKQGEVVESGKRVITLEV